MSSCRGSTLIEVLIAVTIVSIAASSIFKIPLFTLVYSLNKNLKASVAKKAIEDELNFAANSCIRNVSTAQILTSIPSSIIQFSSLTAPALESNFLAYSSLSNHGSSAFPAIHLSDDRVAVSELKYLPLVSTLGCSPLSCIELLCRYGDCEKIDESIFSQNNRELMPFISWIYKIDETVILYRSNRNSLRRISISAGRVSENQPILDNIATFLPLVSHPLKLKSACVVEAIFSTTLDSETFIPSRAIQRIASSHIPLAQLRVGGI